QVPVRGDLSVPQVVDVGVLAGVGAVPDGERGLVQDDGVVVVGQDVVDGDAHLHAGLLETWPRNASTWSRPRQTPSIPAVDSYQVMSSSSSAATAAMSPLPSAS